MNVIITLIFSIIIFISEISINVIQAVWINNDCKKRLDKYRVVWVASTIICFPVILIIYLLVTRIFYKSYCGNCGCEIGTEYKICSICGSSKLNIREIPKIIIITIVAISFLLSSKSLINRVYNVDFNNELRVEGRVL